MGLVAGAKTAVFCRQVTDEERGARTESADDGSSMLDGRDQPRGSPTGTGFTEHAKGVGAFGELDGVGEDAEVRKADRAADVGGERRRGANASGKEEEKEEEKADLTPPTPLSNFAASPLVERGEKRLFLTPPSPRSEAELERGVGG